MKIGQSEESQFQKTDNQREMNLNTEFDRYHIYHPKKVKVRRILKFIFTCFQSFVMHLHIFAGQLSEREGENNRKWPEITIIAIP